MSRGRWFLPESPDVLGMLSEQASLTVEGTDALVAWTAGTPGAAGRLRELEHLADDRKRELRRALSASFMTPLEPEDIFELSRGLDEILNSAKNAVREADVMGTAPDRAIGEMSREIAEGTRQIAAAFGVLENGGGEPATAAADRATKAKRRVEHTYREAMSALIEVDDLRDVAARRELYRRLVRTADRLADVAERVWYAVLKES